MLSAKSEWFLLPLWRTAVLAWNNNHWPTKSLEETKAYCWTAKEEGSTNHPEWKSVGHAVLREGARGRQKGTQTCTMPRVAEVTGSEKSPPGGETAPTMVTLPSRLGEPRQTTRPARS